MKTDWTPLWLALGTYALYLALVVITRAGKGRTPQASVNKLHLRVSAVYLAAAIGKLFWQRRWPGLLDGTDLAIGLFTYFGVHYAIFQNFFVLAQSSVSTALISIIHNHQGRATVAQCDAEYASGEGFSYIKRNRIGRVQNMLGWLEVRDGVYRLTRSGARMARLTKFMLRLWNLKQIGAEK